MSSKKNLKGNFILFLGSLIQLLVLRPRGKVFWEDLLLALLLRIQLILPMVKYQLLSILIRYLNWAVFIFSLDLMFWMDLAGYIGSIAQSLME